mmetsp:Transcript_24478/g.56382  ORF Transcript_24478/g.56382 Transcript_24478/m.56382 type:complete len:204 (+) Transcript_24478:704-1315(+)
MSTASGLDTSVVVAAEEIHVNRARSHGSSGSNEAHASVPKQSSGSIKGNVLSTTPPAAVTTRAKSMVDFPMQSAPAFSSQTVKDIRLPLGLTMKKRKVSLWWPLALRLYSRGLVSASVPTMTSIIGLHDISPSILDLRGKFLVSTMVMNKTPRMASSMRDGSTISFCRHRGHPKLAHISRGNNHRNSKPSTVRNITPKKLFAN